jgi:glycosyltransferase involved in cell wall biosynthesis
MMEALARCGFAVEALTGTVLELGQDIDPDAWLIGRGAAFETCGGEAWSLDARGVRSDVPTHYRMRVRDVPVTLHRSETSLPHEPSDREREDFLRLYESVLERFRPDVLVNFGGDVLAHEVRALARAKGAAVVFALHNFHYSGRDAFATADAVIVPSQFASDYYRKALGLECSVLPCLVDTARALAWNHSREYVTFVNPSVEKGVFAFARMADELGRKRPDIPLLVVEGRGSEKTLVGCGLDLRVHGNVDLMGHTSDPRQFWGVTRVCLMPSLWWENQPLVAIEAMINGVPVIGSDRGGVPETLGGSGVVIPLPGRLTPATRFLPTPEEVAPWVDAITRLWDDPDYFADQQRLAVAESRRWTPEVLEPRYVQFFADIGSVAGSRSTVVGLPRAGNVVAAVPFEDDVSWECDQALRRLEEAGVRVDRRRVSSGLDVTRSAIFSDALHDDAEAVLILDSDIGFDHHDAMRLLARTEPVIAGLPIGSDGYPVKCAFATGVTEVHLGWGAAGMYPLEHAGCEFLRVRCDCLRGVVAALDLPLCNLEQGRGVWPFFQPALLAREKEGPSYLGSVEAFYHRLRLAGITPLADTSIRLSPVGRTSPWARPAKAWDQVPGMFDFARVYDGAVAGASDGAVFVEVGCFAGRSTCYMATKIRESGKDITLYAVDTGRGSASDPTGQIIVPSLGGSLAGILHRNLIGCGLDEIVVPIFTTSAREGKDTHCIKEKTRTA